MQRLLSAGISLAVLAGCTPNHTPARGMEGEVPSGEAQQSIYKKTGAVAPAGAGSPSGAQADIYKKGR